MPRQWRSWADRYPLAVDAVSAVAVSALGVGASLYSPEATTHRFAPVATPFFLAAVALATFRRRAPLPVLGAVTVVGLLSVGLARQGGVTGGAVLLATWTVAVSRSRPVALSAVATVAGALLIQSLAVNGWAAFRAENLNFSIVILLGAAAGIATRERRANLAALVDRADRAEATRESEAARRVAEERLRIARDLHDSLAHHMAVVTVQTGAAAHLVDVDPASAATALRHARAAGGQALAELGTVLGVLRSPADGEPTEPAPSLARLDTLLEPLRAAGLRLRSTVIGRPRPLPPVTDQSAYRVIQEALTNAQKHAAGSSVRLTIEFRDRSVALEIVNSPAGDGRPSGPGADGFGLVGMRERSAAVGGVMDAGSLPDGGFRVFAELPLPPQETVALP